MNTENLLLWDDNPSEVDLLGFESIANPIQKALLRDDLNPVCVGVFGPWGSGKTTVVTATALRTKDKEDRCGIVQSSGDVDVFRRR